MKFFKLPQKVNVAIRANIDNLLKGKFDGSYSDFLVRNLNTKRDLIIFTAHYISSRSKYVYSVEAKYFYGHRAKRIDAVFYKKGELFLFKFVNNKSTLNKKALGLDLLLTDMTRCHQNITITGCLILSFDFREDILRNTQQRLLNNIIFIKKDKIFATKKIDSILDLAINL